MVEGVCNEVIIGTSANEGVCALGSERPVDYLLDTTRGFAAYLEAASSGTVCHSSVLVAFTIMPRPLMATAALENVSSAASRSISRHCSAGSSPRRSPMVVEDRVSEEGRSGQFNEHARVHHPRERECVHAHAGEGSNVMARSGHAGTHSPQSEHGAGRTA